MKKILLLASAALVIFLGYSFVFPEETNRNLEVKPLEPKKEILRVGLVADSHNENDLLARALLEAKNRKVDFVIGLGDYTNLGTVEELTRAKQVFDDSGLEYYAVAGDRDGWDSRQRGLENATNFLQIFGQNSQAVEKQEIQFVLLDNSDIYSGISQEGWEILNSKLETRNQRLIFVFAHKTPFHPDSKHIMGEDSPEVAKQAQKLLAILEEGKVDGFFSGDLHFFAIFFANPRIVTKATEIDASAALHNIAQFKSPEQSVRITTIGAVASERNFQGPRFAILKVFNDYSWEVEDVEIN